MPPFLAPYLSEKNSVVPSFCPLARDIYSVRIRNVRVFVEKRRNVFNFHLLDKRLDVPDPKEVLASMSSSSVSSSLCEPSANGTSYNGRNGDGPTPSGTQDVFGDSIINGNVECVTTDGKNSIVRSDSDKSDGMGIEVNHARDDSATSTSVAETKANEIVKHMLGAVSNLGRAANEGGKEELSNVLMNHKDGVVSYLKKFQNMVGAQESTPVQNSDLSSSDRRDDGRPVNRGEGRLRSRTTMIAKEGIQLMKDVGKVVEKNVLDMKSQVDSLAKPPPRKEGLVMEENPDLFRIGWIIIQDIRIFSKDIILVRGSSAFEDSSNAEVSKEESNTDEYQVKRREQINSSGWSKPILVNEVVIHPTELCPSSLEKDDGNALVIGQPIEHILQVVLIKTLKEMAKCNTDRLLNNAFSEVFAWFGVKRT
eukprot:CAMPEP_0198257492 /NCGR_PEP_ID=MMETSP1447-20131203/7161_1 /TAXON_ID=420782 /ORGANISM="Chaetoceros dichaeta, Strain CCMP1751" /LENGTH=422 /DNA_ID=CAMNT_0043944411 /DNA_START=384 /DNA_END=1652 /DNA_ORIENTATION=+